MNNVLGTKPKSEKRKSFRVAFNFMGFKTFIFGQGHIDSFVSI